MRGLRSVGPRALMVLAAAVVGMPWGVALAAASVPAAAGPAAAGPAAASLTAAHGDFRMTDPRIDESSGLALSRRHPHTVWTANDSGDSARVFAVDTRTGRTTGVHTFDASVTDVEALALAPDGRLLVADIGDNTASRRSVSIHWFEEPALGRTTGPAGVWRLRYPDGAHDAESIAVNPVTGRVYLVTKGTDGAVYALPRHPRQDRPNDLSRVAPAPPVATDAVFLADGSALAVRTYTRVVLLDRSSFREVAAAFLPLQPQGETIALAPGQDALLVGSEGRSSLVQRVPVPAAGRGAGSPASPPPSPSSPSQSPSESPSQSPSSTTRPATRADAGASPSEAQDGTFALGGVQLVGLGSLAVVALGGLCWAALRRRRA